MACSLDKERAVRKHLNSAFVVSSIVGALVYLGVMYYTNNHIRAFFLGLVMVILARFMIINLEVICSKLVTETSPLLRTILAACTVLAPCAAVTLKTGSNGWGLLTAIGFSVVVLLCSLGILLLQAGVVDGKTDGAPSEDLETILPVPR